MSKPMIRNIVLILIVLSAAALVIRYSKGKLYNISVSHSVNDQDKVLAIHLDSNNPNKDNPNVVDHRTVFLMLKSGEQLHFLHTVPQLAALRKSKNPMINRKDEIYNHLYLGFYHQKEHTIYYRSFAKTPVVDITFSHKDIKGDKNKTPHNAGQISLKLKDKEAKAYPIENLVYSVKKLQKCKLVEATNKTSL